MYLARDKYGRLGRKLRDGMGDNPQAVIQNPSCAQRTSTVYVNPEQIQADQAYWDNVKLASDTLAVQNAARSQASADAQERIDSQTASEIAQFQEYVPESKDQAAIRRHFALDAISSEELKTYRKVTGFGPSPNFSLATQVPGERWNAGTANPNSDFNMWQLVGSPLTRDGEYGAVTDYDRFVKGTELTGEEVHVSDSNSQLLKMPDQMGRGGLGRLGRRSEFTKGSKMRRGRMGDDTDWDTVSFDDAPEADSSGFNWGSLFSNVGDVAKTAIQTQIVKSAQPAVKYVTNAAGVKTAVPVTTTTSASVMGIPKPIFYGLAALTALGVGLVIFKAVKK